MTTAGPWSVKGIDPKARELAKDLARRSGMTLGEWLNQMIIEGEIEDDYPPPPPRGPAAREIRLSSDAEQKRIARALDALTQRLEAAEHRSTLAISGIDQQVMGVLSRIEGVERDRAAVAARFDDGLEEVKATQVKVADRLRRLAEEEAPRLEAVKSLEGALGKIAEKLYDVDGKTRSILNEVREDLSNTSRRVDRVEVRVEDRAEADPAAGLVDAVVARLGERLVEAEGRTAQAIRAMEASFAGLDQRFRTSEARNDDTSPERRFERLALELSDKIEANRTELTERLNTAADGKLDRMEAAIRDLAGHVDQGERRSAQAIDRMGHEVMRIAQTLGDRVGSVEARTAEAAQQMGGEMARIAEAMEHRMGRADQVQAEALEKLGSEIAKIAERLADRIANAERRSAAAIDDVGEQVGRVTERLHERYEASQSALAERIRGSEERTARLLEEARETIDRRLIETQRRNALETALVEARRTAEQEEQASSARTFSDDPFASSGPSQDMMRRDALAPAQALAHSPEDQDAFEPAAETLFSPFEDRFDEFAADGVEAETLAPPPAAERAPAETVAAREPLPPAEPMTTREVVAAARAARQAAERSDPASRGKRYALSQGPDLAGSVAAPPLEDRGHSGFSFGLTRRKKKESGVTLRTMIVASGTAAALAATAVGAGAVYLTSEAGTSGEHVEHLGPAPTAAQPDDHKTLASDTAPQPAAPSQANQTAQAQAAPADTLAVALAPQPDAAPQHPAPQPVKAKPIAAAPAPTAPSFPGGMDAHAYYNTAIQRLQTGDAAGADDLQKAANLGYAPAQFYLAKLFETGGSGLKKDLAEARRWTQRAADAGDARAMHNLALYEFNGEGGIKDQADAAHWFKRAAELGVVDSQYNLGRLYESGGYGVPLNRAEAYKWYLVAAGKGDHDARASADTLKTQLPADQAAAAERAAGGFLAQKPAAVETAKAP